MLDPVIYRPTPQTTVQLTALAAIAVNGDIAFDSDLGYHVKFDGTNWVELAPDTDISTKVDKPVASTQGFVATVDATGNDVEYIAPAPTASPASQVDVTAGTANANEYVQADTLKVELDKKINIADIQDDDTSATATATDVASSESVKAYVDNNATVIVDDLVTGGATEALSAEQGKVLQDTKEDKIDTSAFAAAGSENTLGLNTTDTLQTLVTKLNAYVANVPKVLKDVYFADTANLATLQALEPTVTEDDF